MDKKIPPGGGNRGRRDEQQRAAVSVTSLSQALLDCKTSVLLARRAQLERVMKTTADNSTWAAALVAWGAVNEALQALGHRFELPEPARDGWEVAK